MSKSSQYPEERQARRILELACPEAEQEARENLAYLVSKRRMTIDAAMAELGYNNEQSSQSAQDDSSSVRKPSTTAAKDADSTRPASWPAVKARTPSTANERRSSSAAMPPPAVTAARLTSSRQQPPQLQSPSQPLLSVGTGDSVSDATHADHRRGYTRSTAPSTTVSPSKSAPTTATTTTTAAAATTASAAVVMPPVGTRSDARRAPYTAGRSDAHRLSSSSSSSSESRDHEGATEAGQRSAPGVAQEKPLGCPPNGSATTTTIKAVAVALTTPVKEMAEVQTARAERLLSPSRVRGLPAGGGEDAELDGDGEPMFSDTKLVTEAEKAEYEEQMKDMMHYWYREETSMFDATVRSLGKGQVFFFTTSMTGDRRVRDHCRQMETLLYLKLVPHHTIDVADNEFFLRRVRKLYTLATQKKVMPDMPLLFVDQQLIGDFTTVQELEDAGELDARLIEAGCTTLRRRVVAEYEAKRRGVRSSRLALPTSASGASIKAASAPTAASSEPPAIVEKPRAAQGPLAGGSSTRSSARVNGSGGSAALVPPPSARSVAALDSAAPTARPPPPRTGSARQAGGAARRNTSSSDSSSSITASPLPPTSKAPAARPSNTESTRDTPTKAVTPQPCRFANGRRIDSSGDSAAGSAATPTTGTEATVRDAPPPPLPPASTLPPPAGARRMSDTRLSLAGRAAPNTTASRANVAPTTAQRTVHSSAMPRLPSLTDRETAVYDSEGVSPTVQRAATRRHSGQPFAAAASAVTRIGTY